MEKKTSAEMRKNYKKTMSQVAAPESNLIRNRHKENTDLDQDQDLKFIDGGARSDDGQRKSIGDKLSPELMSRSPLKSELNLNVYMDKLQR